MSARVSPPPLSPRVSMLNGTLPLHDVRDLEASCRSILDRALREAGTHYLGPDEYEDVLAEFIAAAWEMSLRYDPERVRDPQSGRIRLSFSTFLNRFLAPRLADWYRRWFGDARYGTPPEFVPWDALLVEAESTAMGSRETGTEEPATFAEVEFGVSLGDPFDEVVEFGFVRGNPAIVSSGSLVIRSASSLNGDVRWFTEKEELDVRPVAC